MRVMRAGFAAAGFGATATAAFGAAATAGFFATGALGATGDLIAFFETTVLVGTAAFFLAGFAAFAAFAVLYQDRPQTTLTICRN